MRVNLNVPFTEKDEARKAGAQWDLARKTWFVARVEDLTPFLKWIPVKLLRPCAPAKKERM